MGCDIHLQVERRVDGKWELVTELPPRACSWCDGSGFYKLHPERAARGEKPSECYSCNGKGKTTRPYHDRNYTVFSVLAGVRSDGYMKPIDEPRGLPKDRVKRIPDEESGNHLWSYGDHSFSWLTLAELRAYDWKQPRKDEGFVEAHAFAEWEASKDAMPSEWCKGTSGKIVTNSELREFIANGYKTGLEAFFPDQANRPVYTLAQWSVPLNDYCKHFLSFMETLSGLGEPDDVRIVFGFDS